jgi:hypothetical protein
MSAGRHHPQESILRGAHLPQFSVKRLGRREDV